MPKSKLPDRAFWERHEEELCAHLVDIRRPDATGAELRFLASLFLSNMCSDLESILKEDANGEASGAEGVPDPGTQEVGKTASIPDAQAGRQESDDAATL